MGKSVIMANMTGSDMKSAFDKTLRRVRWRCGVNLFLDRLTPALTLAGLAALAAGAGEKFFGVRTLQPYVLPGLIATAVAAAGIAWLLARHSTMQVAILIDERLGLRERFSTSLALHNSSDPFAQAACLEAHRAAGKVSIKGKFPVRLSRRWFFTLASWVAVTAVILYMPPLDVLGYMRASDQKVQTAQEIQKAKADLTQQTQKIETAVKQLNDPQLAELAKLDANMPDGVKPEDIRRDAIKKMESLADRIEKTNGQKMDAAGELDKMLRQLRGMPKGQFNDLNTAVAKGDFNKAADMLKELQKQIDADKLTPEQKKALTEQMADIAGQLDRIAKENRDAAEELEKVGLDRKLADAAPEDLRKALENQGLSEEQINEVMKKLAACKSASSQCSELSEALAKAGMSADDIANNLEAVEAELAELEAMEQDADASMAALKEIKKAIRCTGQCQGECKGLCESDDGEDAAVMMATKNRSQSGMRGAGRGADLSRSGEKTRTTPDEFTLEKTKAAAPGGEGPAVASWYVKGSQVKGESKKEFKDVIRAAKDGAAEAINDNEIPKKYEGPVKTYFGELEKASKE